MLQQTTSAQTSPMIRGFTGQSNVYLIDGVRLNTGAWRTGPSRTRRGLPEPSTASRSSVAAARCSTGSDALGGTVQFLSAPRG